MELFDDIIKEGSCHCKISFWVNQEGPSLVKVTGCCILFPILAVKLKKLFMEAKMDAGPGNRFLETRIRFKKIDQNIFIV